MKLNREEFNRNCVKSTLDSEKKVLITNDNLHSTDSSRTDWSGYHTKQDNKLSEIKRTPDYPTFVQTGNKTFKDMHRMWPDNNPNSCIVPYSPVN